MFVTPTDHDSLKYEYTCTKCVWRKSTFTVSKILAKVFVNGSDIYTHTRGKRLRTLSTLLTEDLICTFCAVICLPFGIIQSTLGDNTLNS